MVQVLAFFPKRTPVSGNGRRENWRISAWHAQVSWQLLAVTCMRSRSDSPEDS